MEPEREPVEHVKPPSKLSHPVDDPSRAEAVAADAPPPHVDPKTAEIRDACREADIPRLRLLAESEGGFLTDLLRRRAWPILLGLSVPVDDDGLVDDGTAAVDWKDLARHEDEDQVQLDVNRSFIYYPSGQSDNELEQHKSELSALIVEVLRRYPYLRYFQGYHDICQVFLLVLAPTWRAPVVARLSVLRIRDFMLTNMNPTIAQLRLLPDILDMADPKLRRHMAGVEPFYALAGTLTMYAHDIERYHDIARLFDVFLAREPVFSIYMFAQIVIGRREQIFEIDEPDMLHAILGKVPPNMDLESLITNAVRLFNEYPPEKLRAWGGISSASAFKTARDVGICAKQTMDEGHEYFQQQAKELQWDEFRDRVTATLWAYRQPAKALGMAVAVGAVALYLSRNPAMVNATARFISR